MISSDAWTRRDGAEFGLLLGSAPVLLFPALVPWATLTVLGLWILWFGFLLIRRRFPPLASPLSWPWALLGLAVGAAAFRTPWPDLALPKATGVLLGMLVLRFMIASIRSPLHMSWCLRAYMMAGVVVVLAGVVSAGWTGGKPPTVKSETVNTIASRLPRLLSGLPGAEHGVNRNALGGTTLFFLSVIAVAAIAAKQAWSRAGAAAVFLTLLLVLILSQSRTAWMAAAVTLFILGAVASVVFRKLAVLAVAVAIAAVVVSGPTNVAARLRHSFEHSNIGSTFDPSSGRTVDPWTALTGAGLGPPPGGWPVNTRAQIWARAFVALREHPWTGIGLGAFQREVFRPVPGYNISPLAEVGHAHNVFLQTALDLGVPGLVAYIALMAVTSMLAWRVWRQGRGGNRWWALGLWGNVMAIHLFGMLDAIALGAKVGLFLWWSIGLIVALYRLDFPSRTRLQTVAA